MKIEKAYCHSLFISPRNQTVLFQIKLPNDFKELVSVETTTNAFHFDGPPRGPNFNNALPTPTTTILHDLNLRRAIIYHNSIHLGILRLQESGKQNTFYAQELFLHDNSVPFGDGAQSSIWSGETWSHGRTAAPYFVEIGKENTVVKGFYQNTIEALHTFPLISYKVNIYMWYLPTEKP